MSLSFFVVHWLKVLQSIFYALLHNGAVWLVRACEFWWDIYQKMLPQFPALMYNATGRLMREGARFSQDRMGRYVLPALGVILGLVVTARFVYRRMSQHQ